tara:strand:+ start:42156 stop:43175 length:1020 start_codon:yes stop_codon:yes gene_type:complete
MTLRFCLTAVPFLLTTALACGGDADGGEPGDVSPDAGETVTGPWLDLSADDLAANDSHVFAIQGPSVVAIDRNTKTSAPLFTLPAPDDGSYLSIEFRYADNEMLLINTLSLGGANSASANQLWHVNLDTGVGTSLMNSEDTRFFRGDAALHEGSVFANSAFDVLSFELESPDTSSSYGNSTGGSWTSNPVIDVDGMVWFAQNSDLYRASATNHNGRSLSPHLSVGGFGPQESRLFLNANRDDLLVWMPGENPAAGLVGYLFHVNTSTSEFGEARELNLNADLNQVVRAGDELLICTNDGLYRASTDRDPTMIQASQSCAVTSDDTVAFAALDDGIHFLE